MLNGYWEYAGTRYNSKIKATEAASGKSNEITFVPFASSFYSYAWFREPAESWDEILKQRALQLRDNYKHLKLWFSGGADSTTILNTFLKNDIYLDEIVVYLQSFNNDFDIPANYELTRYTLPYLKALENTLLFKTKIKILEVGSDYYDDYLNDEKWLYTKGSFDLRHTFVPNIRGKNYCNIFGDSDPHIFYKEGKWFTTFWDTSNFVELMSCRNIEMFYTDETMPSVHAKQCHILKNYFKHVNKFQSDKIDDEYKTTMRSLVRDTPIVKDQLSKSNMLMPIKNYKLNSMLRFASSKQIDRLKYIYGSTVNDNPVIRLLQPAKTQDIWLGD